MDPAEPDVDDEYEVNREHEVYFATLAEQAERYDEMAEHMRTAANLDADLGKEERNLLAVAYKQAVAQRRSSWRIACNAELVEEGKGNDDMAACARNYRKQIEGEMRSLCNTILALLTQKLIPKASTAEAKVTYYKAKGDYHRYIAEISDDVEKAREASEAKASYQEGTRIAEQSLPVTSSMRLGLALNHAVFFNEVMKAPTEAIRIARKALEDAVREIDNLGENGAKESALVIGLLRDNLALWTAQDTTV
eukprot:TRINITY_DN77850_c0_g1_i1.p1 TRINITY_DN77850_c0_g1~~TRINITY_DN77850_c0_g1_i1.p1  ORF type:complete len:251 (-),score=78.35 TRINITY_DN77850_c0_g1_i1:197-949(-)